MTKDRFTFPFGPPTARRGGVPTTRDVASHYATLKAELWETGRPIDENDIWIAAAALTHGLVLLGSDADFRGIPGLVVENWSLE